MQKPLERQGLLRENPLDATVEIYTRGDRSLSREGMLGEETVVGLGGFSVSWLLIQGVETPQGDCQGPAWSDGGKGGSVHQGRALQKRES